MKYFTHCETLEDLRKAYRKLAMENHPDRGGSEKVMQEINAEYSMLHDRLQRRENADQPENKQSYDTAAEFVAIIDKLMKVKGIRVELCGCWLWISGDTRAVKDELSAAGCHFSSKKKMWYWHPGKQPRHKCRRSMDMGYIRMKYGSAIVRDEETA